MKSVTLQFREGSSDKVYQASIEPSGNLFVVNIAFGRRGVTLQTGTKTPIPVDWQKADHVFTKLINEKKAKGYTEAENGTPYQQTPTETRVSGFLPQLLNPISEDRVQSFLTDDNWCVQEKKDGQRVLLQKTGSNVQGINRRGLSIGLPSTVVLSAQTIPHDFVIDGECIGDNHCAFDILEVNGKDLRKLPYQARLTEMINMLASGMPRHIQMINTAYSTKQKLVLLTDLKLAKAEGIVFKRLDAPYTAGRPNSGGTQLKHKFYATLSAVVSEINEKRSVEIRLLYEDGWRPAGNVTIPPNQNIPPVGTIVEVRYLYAFKESGVLYQPTFLGTRTDITHFDCSCSQLKYKAAEEDEG